MSRIERALENLRELPTPAQEPLLRGGLPSAAYRAAVPFGCVVDGVLPIIGFRRKAVGSRRA
jgi:hypothetical protein